MEQNDDWEASWLKSGQKYETDRQTYDRLQLTLVLRQATN